MKTAREKMSIWAICMFNDTSMGDKKKLERVGPRRVQNDCEEQVCANNMVLTELDKSKGFDLTTSSTCTIWIRWGRTFDS